MNLQVDSLASFIYRFLGGAEERDLRLVPRKRPKLMFDRISFDSFRARASNSELVPILRISPRACHSCLFKPKAPHVEDPEERSESGSEANRGRKIEKGFVTLGARFDH